MVDTPVTIGHLLGVAGLFLTLLLWLIKALMSRLSEGRETMGNHTGQLSAVRVGLVEVRGAVETASERMGGRIEVLAAKVEASNGRLERVEADFEEMRSRWADALAVHARVMEKVVADLGELNRRRG